MRLGGSSPVAMEKTKALTYLLSVQSGECVGIFLLKPSVHWKALHT